MNHNLYYRRKEYIEIYGNDLFTSKKIIHRKTTQSHRFFLDLTAHFLPLQIVQTKLISHRFSFVFLKKRTNPQVL